MPVIHGYITALRFLRKRPPGPRWLHLALAGVGALLASRTHQALTPSLGAIWAGLAALALAMGFYMILEESLGRFFPDDDAPASPENEAP